MYPDVGIVPVCGSSYVNWPRVEKPMIGNQHAMNNGNFTLSFENFGHSDGKCIGFVATFLQTARRCNGVRSEPQTTAPLWFRSRWDCLRAGRKTEFASYRVLEVLLDTSFNEISASETAASVCFRSAFCFDVTVHRFQWKHIAELRWIEGYSGLHRSVISSCGERWSGWGKPNNKSGGQSIFGRGVLSKQLSDRLLAAHDPFSPACENLRRRTVQSGCRK